MSGLVLCVVSVSTCHQCLVVLLSSALRWSECLVLCVVRVSTCHHQCLVVLSVFSMRWSECLVLVFVAYARVISVSWSGCLQH